jgi:hypothetical protein
MLHGVLTEYLHRYLEIRRSLWRNAGAAPSLYSDAETAVGAKWIFNLSILPQMTTIINFYFS